MAKKQITVALDGNGHLRVGFGSKASALIKLVEGKPPAWLKLIPKKKPILESMVFAPEMETAVRRVSDVASDSKGIVRFVFTDDIVTVSAISDDQTVEASISTIDTKGSPNRVALNVKYLLDYLRGRQGLVRISWTGGTSPVVLSHGKNPQVLIMPMTVQWGDEAEPQPSPETNDNKATEETPPQDKSVKADEEEPKEKKSRRKPKA